MSSTPQIIINGKEQPNVLSFNLSFQGNNQLNSASIKLSSPEYDENTLFGKVVEIFLNNGGLDTVPIFRGIIKEVNTSETNMSIKAVDVRGYISGKDSLSINLTDNDNFDGFTVGQFLRKYINDNINTSETRIGLDFLNDTSNSVNLTGIRGKKNPLQMCVEAIEEELDDTDFDNPLSYIIDVEEGPLYSNLIIKKQKLLTEETSLSLSLSDGISKYQYQRRPVPTQITVEDTASNNFYKTKLGNSPQGPFADNIAKEFKDPSEASKHAILHLKRLQAEVNDISIDATRGYHLGLESLISVHVNKDEIDGVHRLVSKTINYDNKSGFKLKLTLNKRPIKVSNYLSIQ
tara:strand:- start:90 stop:1130 length:1041 start_codon:yes stop_codon:yes gene_type:complete